MPSIVIVGAGAVGVEFASFFHDMGAAVTLVEYLPAIVPLEDAEAERLARFLLEHCCIRQTDGAKVLVHATQSEIAARLGTVREVVARTLSDFIGRGLVSRSDAGLFVDDWKGFKSSPVSM